MPIQTCQADGKPGFKWGDAGKCYTYTAGDDASRNAAKQKAIKQGLAAGGGKLEERMLTIDGMDWRVVLSTRELESDEGGVAVLGLLTETDNIIMLDGTANGQRQEEVLLHEIIHLSAMDMPEYYVGALSRGLYGSLKTNDVLKAKWFKGLVDRDATEDEMVAVEAVLTQQEKDMQAGIGGGLMRAARAKTPATAGQVGSQTEGEGGPPDDASDASGDSGAAGAVQGNGGDVTGLKVVNANLVREKRTAIEELRTLRKQLKAYEDRDKTAEQKQAEELVTLQKAAADSEARATAALRKAAFVTAAARVGVVNPDSAFRLVDAASLTVDGEGKVAGVDEALAALKQSDPYMFRGAAGQSTDAGATGDAPQKATYTPEQVDMARKLGVTTLS